MRRHHNDDEMPKYIWARPEMLVTFRAEIMRTVTRKERTFRIQKVLPNGRVTLHDIVGEFRETAFEAINFLREKGRSEAPADPSI
jgi:hypothetical protein